MENERYYVEAPLYHWKALGRALERGVDGTIDSMVTGDPCIVWEEESQKWLMYYFAAGNKPGTAGMKIGMALSRSKTEVGAGDWEKLGEPEYANPEDIWQNSPHKPWIVMDPYRPNHAAKIDGKYMLFFVSKIGLNCVIQRAWSSSLYGPWEVQRKPVLRPDTIDGFDSYHTDTVSAYWFEKAGKILLFYKGYPQCEQKDQPESPFGSSTATAVMTPDSETAVKLGEILKPSHDIGHWTSGWTSGIQLLPRGDGKWLGLTTASPTPPDSLWNQLYMREPNPSLGGWAFCDETFPAGQWKTDARPIKWIHALSEDEIRYGERVHLFRHHLLILQDGTRYLYYNSGPYNNERMFVHVEEREEA